MAMGAVAIPVAVVSAQYKTVSDDFATSLASKLGVSEDSVKSALTQVQVEHHEQREAERDAKIATAVAEGKLTQRQADLLEAMHTIMEDKRASGEFKNGQDLKDLTEAERQALMQENRETRKSEMLTGLNNKGLNVSAEELDSLHTTMLELGLNGKGAGSQGGRGMGFGRN